MDNIWIQKISKINLTENTINITYNLYVPQDIYEIDKNIFPTSAEVLNYNDKYEDAKVVRAEESLTESGIYCKEQFEVRPIPSTLLINITDNEYAEIEQFLYKNYRLHTESILIVEN